MHDLPSYRVRSARPRRRRSANSTWLPLLLAVGAMLSGLCLLLLVPVTLLGRSSLPLGEGSRAFNVLVLGVDQRSDESGPTRSDSMILIGSDATTGKAAILSIPRDLWVDIPGVGQQRINTALFFGYESDDPTAGPRLAAQTVASQFGVPVDRYLVLDFQTFVRFIDALGGVEVDVPRPITDAEYPTPDYGVTTVHFDAGPQTLDGERALIYVRTRHADSDFGRAERQQQVVRAIAAKLVDPATWPRLPAAYAVLRDGMITDLTPNDAPALLPLVQAIANGEVTMAMLDDDLATPWITPGGAWVLLPNWPAIRTLVGQLFGPRP